MASAEDWRLFCFAVYYSRAETSSLSLQSPAMKQYLSIIFVLSFLTVGCCSTRQQPARPFTNTRSNTAIASPAVTPTAAAATPMATPSAISAVKAKTNPAGSPVSSQQTASKSVPANVSAAAPRPPSQPATPRRAPMPAPTAQSRFPAPPDPPNATARCRDGSYSFSARHQGSCSHHGGVAALL